MSLSEAFLRLRQAHNTELALCMQPVVTRLPTPAEVNTVEAFLSVTFHDDYRRFLLEASDVVTGHVDTAIVTPNAGHRGLIKTATAAWDFVGLPRDLLPICEDNANYFCMASSGQSAEVVYWSHDGWTDEKWPDFAAWITQVWLKGETSE